MTPYPCISIGMISEKRLFIFIMIYDIPLFLKVPLYKEEIKKVLTKK